MPRKRATPKEPAKGIHRKIDYSSLVRVPDHRLRFENGAANNHVFLFEYMDGLGIASAPGWKPIGYANPPCYKADCFALVFERTEETVERFSDGSDFNAGDIIWHHFTASNLDDEKHPAHAFVCKP